MVRRSVVVLCYCSNDPWCQWNVKITDEGRWNCGGKLCLRNVIVENSGSASDSGSLLCFVGIAASMCHAAANAIATDLNALPLACPFPPPYEPNIFHLLVWLGKAALGHTQGAPSPLQVDIGRVLTWVNWVIAPLTQPTWPN